MKVPKPFLFGFVGGALLTLGLVLFIRALGPAPRGEIVAEIQGETLREAELRKEVAADLIPIENDEYRVLERGLNAWLERRLLEKEAKAQGKTLEEIYQKEIWSRVQISYEELFEHYQKNRELYPEPFEKLIPQLSHQLRQIKYARAKDDYLASLRQKYQVKIHLKKPETFVEGLALPPLPEAPRKVEAPLPAPLPGLANLPVEARSEMGRPPSRGPESAPITLTEFADFHCPFCKKVVPTLEQTMKNYAGKVRWVFRHYPLSATPGAGSFLTHEAAVCAQEQGKFWEFHDSVFAFPGAPQESDLHQMAQQIGLDPGRFQECLKSGRYQSFLQKEVSEGNQRGVEGTPTIYVNDQEVAGAYPYEHFVKVIEGILSPGKAVAAPPAPAPSPTPAAVVRFEDLEGRPSLGPKEAPITLVEFSDFHCPFCKRLTPTLEQLMKNYQGKIRRVWRHYPLAMHPGAERTHAASECAHEQGKFWKYHAKLFEAPAPPPDEAALIRLAEEVGLHKKKFEKCLTSGKYKELIQKEIAQAQAVGARGTPTVFVNGKLIPGAQPYENFDRLIQSELSTVATTVARQQ